MPEKKAKKKAATKKTASRKSAVKKTTTKKAARKSSAKKAASKKTAASKSRSAKKTPSKKAAKKPQASDFVKRPSHTPAIFKPASKRLAHIVFSIEEVREVLKKRAAEKKVEEAARKAVARKQKEKPVESPSVEELDPPKKSKHAAASLDDILGLSSPVSNGKNNPTKVPRKFQKYYALLIELRDQVREELNLHSNDTLKRSQKEDSGDISTSVDAGTDNFDRDFALSLLSTEQDALKEIEAAIQRIHNGSYGVCEVTGEPIKEERLEAVPFTRFSVEGQKEYESTSRRRVSRAGAFLNEASGEKITFGDDDGDN